MPAAEFQKGDEVTCLRHRHGWNDGAHGIITHIGHRSGGSAFYTVKDLETGQEYEVRHTCDLQAK